MVSKQPWRSTAIAAALAAQLGALALAAAPMPTSFEFLGLAELPGGLVVDGTPLGGLSGLVWDRAAGDFVALSDDRSERAPARLVRLGIALDGGRLTNQGITPRSIVTLTRDGSPFPPRSLDPEGLAISRRGYFVSSEGESKRGVAPFVAEFDSVGHWLRDLPLAARYLPGFDAAGKPRGVRDNLAFEALALSPDERYLFTATENGLAQESPAAAPGVSSLGRILRWDLERGGAAEEFLFRVEPINRTPPTPTDFYVNGLVELLAFDATNLLALERQYVPGIGVSIRLYAVSIAGLESVAEVEPPRTATLPVAAKTLLFDFADLGVRLDNFEGMAFGPPLADGRTPLYIVSDDNFDPVAQRTLFLGFAVGSEPLSIAALQGAAHRSPLEGRFVAGVEGVVTAVEDSKRSRGFWLESEKPDSDPATSEAIFVDWEGATTLHAGDRVRVGGRVEERESARNLSVTTLKLAALEPLPGVSRLPAPPRLGRDRKVPAAADDDALATFDPAGEAIDFWESLESMRVELPAGTVIGPTRSFGEISFLPDGARVAARTDRGGALFTAAGPDLSRVQVGRRISGRMPDLAVGDRIDHPFTGIVDYGFSNYHVQPLAPLEARETAASRPPGPAGAPGTCGDPTALAASRGTLTLATLNVENLSIAGGADRMPAFGRVVVQELRSPAILSLEEIQDDSGVADDGVVTARATLDGFIAAIAAAGGPRYAATSIDPENNRDGGQPSGNIRVVLLYDPLRAELVQHGTAGPHDSTAVAGRGRSATLTLSPGRIAADSPAFNFASGEGVRKSLAAEFRVGHERLFVVANHLSSKWDDDRLFGARQPPVAPTGEKRLRQTRELRTFAEELLAADPNANLVILGDLNEPEWAAGVASLARPPLVNLMRRLPAADRYTFNFEGLSQAIDHVLVSPALAEGAEIDALHRNSDCPDSVRVSDHDPVIARLRLH